ncbi:MAG: hypothetical protein MJ051_03950 [Akkermansia sp.]|nr:hypothetical protein [Akkermansia sp.]
MAFIHSTDAAGNTLRYELPAEEGVLITLGCAEDATLRFEGEGVAAQHATLTFTDGQYAISPAEGAVTVNGAPIEGAMLLVEGVDYAIGSLHLSFSPEAGADEEGEAPAEESEPQKKVVRRKKSLRSTLNTPAPVSRTENPIVTLIIPFYAIAVVAAAFVAGLTLRYWIVTGGFLPAEWLNK